MEQFQTGVWLPDETNYCDYFEMCTFFTGGYCLLLAEILTKGDTLYTKSVRCPAHKSEKER